MPESIPRLEFVAVKKPVVPVAKDPLRLALLTTTPGPTNDWASCWALVLAVVVT